MPHISNYALTAVSRLILITGQLAYVKVITHFLQLPEVGVYYLLVAASYFANALVFVPFDYYQQSKINDVFGEQGTLWSYLRPNALLIGSFLLFAILAAAVAAFFSAVLPYWILVATFFAIGNYLPLALKGALNILGHARKINSVQIFEGIFRPLTAVAVAYWVSKPSAITLMCSGGIASILVSSLLIWIMAKQGLWLPSSQPSISWKWAQVRRTAFPISLSAITNWFQLQAYRLVLVPLGFADAVGVYSVMANLGHAGMGAISGIYSQVNLPKIYLSRGTFLEKYLLGALVLTLISATGAMILAPILVPLVTQARYTEFAEIVIFGVAIEGLGSIIGGLIVYFTIKSKTEIIAKSGFLAAASSAFAMVLLYFANGINALTIGGVLIASQCLAVGSLYFVYIRSKR